MIKLLKKAIALGESFKSEDKINQSAYCQKRKYPLSKSLTFLILPSIYPYFFFLYLHMGFPS
jgi:hypothetical protein